MHRHKHYVEAERLLKEATADREDHGINTTFIALAQVHAILASTTREVVNQALDIETTTGAANIEQHEWLPGDPTGYEQPIRETFEAARNYVAGTSKPKDQVDVADAELRERYAQGPHSAAQELADGP